MNYPVFVKGEPPLGLPTPPIVSLRPFWSIVGRLCMILYMPFDNVAFWLYIRSSFMLVLIFSRSALEVSSAYLSFIPFLLDSAWYLWNAMSPFLISSSLVKLIDLLKFFFSSTKLFLLYGIKVFYDLKSVNLLCGIWVWLLFKVDFLLNWVIFWSGLRVYSWLDDFLIS